jgi:hypothetical protein
MVNHEPVALLVAHGYKAAAVCELVSGLTGRPWVGAARGFTGENRRVRSYEALELGLLRRARRVVAVSQGTAAMLAERGIPAGRIRTIPNSVDVGAWLPRRGPGDYWLYSGRLSPEKNPAGALAALARLPSEIRLRIAGDGPLRAELEREAERLGIAGRVEFLGFRRDMAELYSGAIGLCLPSLKEGLPNAVLEALSAALPVVATRVGGVPELIRSGETGLLVEPGDVEALAAAMNRVGSEPGLAAAWGAAGQSRVRDLFGFERQRELWDDLYADVYRSESRVSVDLRQRIRVGLGGRVGAALTPGPGLPFVLAIHRVVDLTDPLEDSCRSPWIGSRSFEQLLEALERDCRVVGLGELAHPPAWDRPGVALALFDVSPENLANVLPGIASRGWPVQAFVGVESDREQADEAWQDALWSGALDLFHRGLPMPALWRGVWPSEPARTRKDLASQCRKACVRMGRWEASRRLEAVATLPGSAAAGISGPLPADPSFPHGFAAELSLVLPAWLCREDRSDSFLRDELSLRLAEWSRQRGGVPAFLALPEGARASVRAGAARVARELGFLRVLAPALGRVDPESGSVLWPRVLLQEEDVVGVDGRFSLDRVRFQLARLR